MPLNGMLTCGSCGARTQMNTMRYNLSGTKLICQSCVERERSFIKPGTTHAIRLQREQMQQKQQKQKMHITDNAASDLQQAPLQDEATGKEGMVSYYCGSCHFKFSRRKDVDVLTCPYCGRQSLSIAYEGKAQDLIEEVDEEKEKDELLFRFKR